MIEKAVSNLFFSLFCLLLLTQCGKKIQCDGVVLSKNRIPVPNAQFVIALTEGGKSGGSHIMSYTDINGRFFVNERIRRRNRIHHYEALAGDSGHFFSGQNSPELHSDMIIILE